MDLSSFFLLLVVVLLVVTIVGWPFLTRWHDQMESGHEVSSLLAERDRVLNAIQELDFDNSLGKIPPEEYPVQRKALLQLGAEVLRKVDALSPMAERTISRGVKNMANDNERITAITGTKTISDEELEEMIAARRATHNEKTNGFCPNCGKPLSESDLFCSCCGQAIKTSSTNQEIT
jgi:NADH pyrophosphatase NudC (nudix superfamily)